MMESMITWQLRSYFSSLHTTLSNVPKVTTTKRSILPSLAAKKTESEWTRRIETESKRKRDQMMAGGIHDVPDSRNNLEIDSLARFAVEDYNKKQNAGLEYGKALSAKGQVVAGYLYYITLEATDDGKKKVDETKILEQAWLNVKEVQEFKPVGDAPSASSS